jgi:hypothetical protein
MNKIKQKTPVLTVEILNAEATLLILQQNLFPSN